MLQARTKSFFLSQDEGDSNVSITSSYFEPGFNIMSPLEFEIERCDQFTLRLRKRDDDTGESFGFLPTSSMEVTVTDPTNGQDVPFSLLTVNSTRFDLTIVNSLNLANPVVRVRTIDVYIKDTRDDDFIILRVLLDDQDKNFNYLFIDTNGMNERNPFTAQGRDIYLSVTATGDYYLLFSPYAYLKETTSSQANFSYPLNTIFYKRQDSYNNEDYTFSISRYSHSFLEDVVSVMNVPSYHKAGVLLVDNRMYKDIIETGVNPYVEIAVIGKLSGISDIFKINFTT